jgi:hypothetical protein
LNFKINKPKKKLASDGDGGTSMEVAMANIISLVMESWEELRGKIASK